MIFLCFFYGYALKSNKTKVEKIKIETKATSKNKKTQKNLCQKEKIMLTNNNGVTLLAKGLDMHSRHLLVQSSNKNVRTICEISSDFDKFLANENI